MYRVKSLYECIHIITGGDHQYVAAIKFGLLKFYSVNIFSLLIRVILNIWKLLYKDQTQQLPINIPYYMMLLRCMDELTHSFLYLVTIHYHQNKSIGVHEKEYVSQGELLSMIEAYVFITSIYKNLILSDGNKYPHVLAGLGRLLIWLNPCFYSYAIQTYKNISWEDLMRISQLGYKQNNYTIELLDNKGLLQHLNDYTHSVPRLFSMLGTELNLTYINEIALRLQYVVSDISIYATNKSNEIAGVNVNDNNIDSIIDINVGSEIDQKMTYISSACYCVGSLLCILEKFYAFYTTAKNEDVRCAEIAGGLLKNMWYRLLSTNLNFDDKLLKIILLKSLVSSYSMNYVDTNSQCIPTQTSNAVGITAVQQDVSAYALSMLLKNVCSRYNAI